MANEKVGVDIEVNTGDSDKKLKDTKDQIQDLGDSAKKSEKDAKSAGGAFGSLGNTLKSLGIITVIAGAFNFFKETLSKNQKVADSVAAVFNTISTIISNLVDIFISVTSEVGKSSNGFEALGKVLTGIFTLAITPLKVAFDGIKLVIKEVQLAWEQSPFGDKEQTVIKQLTADIEATKESLSKTGKNAVQAGKDIYNNFGEAASSVVDVVSKTVDKASKMNVAAIYEQSKATIALQNQAKIAAAQLAGLVERYDRQAEQLRQIRDDEFKSIDERIAANAALGKVLDQQEKAQKALAQQRVAAAAAELAQNKQSVELQAALIEAQNEVAAVEAQVAGLRSEQLVNATALTKEKLALDQSIAASENKLLIDRKKANAELIKDEITKLETQKEIAKDEAALELARLQQNINNTNAGTQARVDAEIAYAEKKQEIDLQLESLDNQISVAEYAREIERLDREQELLTMDYDQKLASIEAEKLLNEEAYAAGLISKQEYTDNINKLTQDQVDTEKAAIEARIAIQMQYADYLQQFGTLLSQVAGKSKALAIAGIVIEQGAALAKVLMQTSAANIAATSAAAPFIANPFTSAIATANLARTILFNNIQAGLSSAGIVAGAVKGISAINSSGIPGGGGGGGAAAVSGGSSLASAPVSPAVPIQNTRTQIDQQSINQMGSATNRAYVIESDVTNNQERIKRINRAARLT
jgi:hypothetical protein